MLDKDDKKFINKIRKAVKGNAGISLEEIAEMLDKSTDLVLNYIELTDNVEEYKPNKFRLNLYYWLNDRTNDSCIVDGKTFISKEQACEYLFNSVLCVSESTRETYKQSDIELQLETISGYGYALAKEYN